MSFRLGFKVEGIERGTAGFAAFKTGLLERITRMLTDTGEHVTGVAREDYLSGPRPERLGRKSGQLAARTTYRVDGNEVSIGNNLSYGRIWEEGGTIPAHTILPKNGRFLVFQMNGQTVFARMVRKPARTVEARPYLKPALNDSVAKIRDIAQFWANDALTAAFPGGTA